eukprot:TRINITY_DN2399_c0_g1_i1.p1 TRINITY_DN2399_c0_g1~~TRINITY_DN2399_c0_g1_i1.p1  ORF type:complete len:111 (-),score=22.82 TRINITY_DN2399_c0_g1_i1:112-444(-)
MRSAMNRSISVQLAKVVYNGLQAMILVAFIGVVLSSLMSSEDSSYTSSLLNFDFPSKLPMSEICTQPGCIQPEEKLCATSNKGWIVLPMAFLTGGLINMDGFASSATLLL